MKLKPNKSILVQCLSALSILLVLPTVASAYGAQLNKTDFPDDLDNSMSMFAVNFRPITAATPTIPKETKALHMAASSQSFITRTLQKTSKTNTALLWSMYPASVRGRAFGATGGNPLSSGGW